MSFSTFQAHAEEASPSQHVRDLGKGTLSPPHGRRVFVGNAFPRVFACPQEDDIDGEHIVAFAEEDDPGGSFCPDRAAGPLTGASPEPPNQTATSSWRS